MPHIRRVQERMAATPNCFVGPDYDTGLVVADRFDYIHLSESGQQKAAKLWADALTDSFFKQSAPHILEPVPDLATDATTVPVDSIIASNAPSKGGIISASLLPNASRLSDWAAIGLIILSIAFLAFLLRQYFNQE